MRESVDLVTIESQDITDEAFAGVRDVGFVAWDLETTGLDWASDQIATCQIWTPSIGAQIVRVSADEPPKRLIDILTDGMIKKFFHHAMFDLRFMRHSWHVAAQNVVCTKIAAKILDPQADNSLRGLLHRYLAVSIDKTQQLSDWTQPILSDEQQRYAATDVRYLLSLHSTLMHLLGEESRVMWAQNCFDGNIPTRVELDVGGIGDVFTY